MGIGSKAYFTLTATGTGTLTYQWQWSANGTTWANTSLRGFNTKDTLGTISIYAAPASARVNKLQNLISAPGAMAPGAFAFASALPVPRRRAGRCCACHSLTGR